ncbi:MAG: AMP-binding protein, partial [Cyanobacteriota bacterium]|nr:AMP-binding protein [Cyanobacteriota bacterium]
QDELLVRGPNVMKGYWQNPSATAAAIDPDGWLHTNDRGGFDAAGRICITGRLNEIIVNPLSYAIEPIRYLYIHQSWNLNSVVMHAFWGDVTFGGAILVLLGFAIVALLSIQSRLRRTLA